MKSTDLLFGYKHECKPVPELYTVKGSADNVVENAPHAENNSEISILKFGYEPASSFNKMYILTKQRFTVASIHSFNCTAGIYFPFSVCLEGKYGKHIQIQWYLLNGSNTGYSFAEVDFAFCLVTTELTSSPQTCL